MPKIDFLTSKLVRQRLQFLSFYDDKPVIHFCISLSIRYAFLSHDHLLQNYMEQEYN